MTHLSHVAPLSPVSLPGPVDGADTRPIRRLALFQLDDAVRDARLGATVVSWVPKKHTPIAALARYQAEHPDMQFVVDEDQRRFRVVIALRSDTHVQ